jgi:predicted NBD/HSP70 family sugar kinase
MASSSNALRFVNQRALLKQLLLAGPSTRAALASQLELTRTTAGKIIDDLLAAEVVEESAVIPHGKAGRPGRLVSLNTTTPRFVLIDLGVSRTRVLTSTVSGKVGSQHEFKTPNSRATWLKGLERVLTQLPRGVHTGLWGFAVSLPGIIDEQRGASVFSPNLRWEESDDLLEQMALRVGGPGSALQESRALALGYLSAEKEHDSFLLVDSEEGVGSAIVLHGRLFDGASNAVGEIGHTRVPGANDACGCGGFGCLETLLARPRLLAAFARHARVPEPSWADLVRHVGSQTPLPPWLCQALDAGATVIASVLNTLGLNRVVLSGAFAQLPESAERRLIDKLHEASLADRLNGLHVHTALPARADGLHKAAVERLLFETADWSAPCLRDPNAARIRLSRAL